MGFQPVDASTWRSLTERAVFFGFVDEDVVHALL